MEVEAQMKILIACEFSGRVRDAFYERGHDVMSCDLIDSEQPGWHYRGDVFNIINDGWDMMIAHPPCTYLTVTANRSFLNNPMRWKQRLDAMYFVYALMNCDIEKICIENPVGVISTHIRKPDQYIQPWWFGHPETKATGLWLKNLPLLYHNAAPNLFDSVVTHTTKGEFHTTKSGKKLPSWYNLPPSEDRAKQRSKTFPGIARAMAEQWTKS